MVSSESSTVAELATTLQVELSQLQAAASFACRLAWAVKIIDPGSILQDPNSPGPSRNVVLGDEDDCSRASVGSVNTSVDGSVFQPDGSDAHGPTSGYARVAFVVDAEITSYLMMGSVSPGNSVLSSSSSWLGYMQEISWFFVLNGFCRLKVTCSNIIRSRKTGSC